jgi:hypothetical protein
MLTVIVSVPADSFTETWLPTKLTFCAVDVVANPKKEDKRRKRNDRIMWF